MPLKVQLEFHFPESRYFPAQEIWRFQENVNRFVRRKFLLGLGFVSIHE